jgi:muramoyltetrapeptide carboxypeptidase
VSLRKPRPLRPGDRIAIVAPASPLPRHEVERGAAELARLGYVPVYDDSLFACHSGYLAGTAGERAAAFLRYWEDPAIAALIAARGGFGSVHLLPSLAPLASMPPKLFIGYSDLTTVLSWLTCQMRTAALYGPMIEGCLARGPNGYDEASFMALVRGGRGWVLAPESLEVVRSGSARGPLYGGTMTQLAASLGTPYAFDPPDGCVLFLEDVNERPYRLDRLLTQLWLSGILGRARALVFGEMRGCDEPDGRVTARQVVDRFARECPGPAIFGFPSGHTGGRCWTLPLGVDVTVATSPRPFITIEEAPVE